MAWTAATSCDEDASVIRKLDALNANLRWLQIEIAGKCQQAFVFVKPHACNDKVQDLVREKFAAAGIRIISEGDLDAETIDRDMLIDNHYGAIAAKAVKLDPSELNVPAKGKAAFKKAFGLSWDDAVAKGYVMNAAQAAKKLGASAEEMDARWSKLSRGKTLLKFGGGFYCGKLGDNLFVMNGFYMNMRAVYTTPPAKLHWYTVQWPTGLLSWADFREKVLGATDPSTAAEGSLRRTILDNYTELGLEGKPDTGSNGMHASASPFEALAERMNWTGVEVTEDPYGRALIAAGVSEATIKEWTQDPQVTFNGEKGSLFDLLEDLDSDTVLAKAANVAKQN